MTNFGFISYLYFNFFLFQYGMKFYSEELYNILHFIGLINFIFISFIVFLYNKYVDKNFAKYNFKVIISFNKIYLFYILLTLIILFNGSPVFSDEIDHSKVIFNNGVGIIIIRIVRYTTFILSYILAIEMCRNHINKHKYYIFIILSMSCLFLLGYKGDMFTPIIIGCLALLNHHPNKFRFKYIFYVFIIIYCLLYFLSLRYEFHIIDALNYLTFRLTASNAEGFFVLHTYISDIKFYDFSDLLFGNLYNKILGNYDGESLNTLLMSIAKLYENPLRMQLSTFGFGFTFLYLGFPGIFLQLLIMSILILYLSSTLFISRYSYVIKILLLIYVSGFFFGQEFLINLPDFLVSSILCVIFLFTSNTIIFIKNK